ncbi:hypothetical protein SLE2022_287650 [Rubroshorea leprosula]
MDTAQWSEGIGVINKPMEAATRPLVERRTRLQKDQALNCPRCNSTNTKFCYYNNYSLSQPRYFCKTCRRYWTEGGSLRNVPVGGGSRKNKRSTSSSSSTPSSKSTSTSPAASSKKLVIDDLSTPVAFPQSCSQNPKIHEGQDLNLAYPSTEEHHHFNSIPKFPDVPFSSDDNKSHHPNPSSTAMELLKTGNMTSRGLMSPFMPIPVSDSSTIYSTGFPIQEFKPTLNFSLEGFESEYGNLQGVQENDPARLLFPMVDLKQVPSTNQVEQNKGRGKSGGYWTEMLGGGSW